MATINYKEKYEKAVQAAMLAKQDTESAVTIGILEEIFPELRESEDERIRKEIIAHIKWCEDSGYCAKEEMTRWIAWLEEQGEQKPAWSEEEEQHIRELESLVKQVWLIAEHENDKDNIHKMSDLSFFLKTLKPQLKQEWSEDDRRIFSNINLYIRKAGDYLHFDKENIKEAINWFNSLKERYTWKPSELQIEALAIAIRCGIKLGTWEEEALKDLIEQLKKLKG